MNMFIDFLLSIWHQSLPSKSSKERSREGRVKRFFPGLNRSVGETKALLVACSLSTSLKMLTKGLVRMVFPPKQAPKYSSSWSNSAWPGRKGVRRCLAGMQREHPEEELKGPDSIRPGPGNWWRPSHLTLCCEARPGWGPLTPRAPWASLRATGQPWLFFVRFFLKCVLEIWKLGLRGTQKI